MRVVHGSHLVTIHDVLPFFPEFVTIDKFKVLAWWLHGGCMVVAWWLYGGCMVVVCSFMVFCGCMVVA